MEKEKRGLLQAMLDAAMREEVKYGPKGRPRRGLMKGAGRSKSKKEDVDALIAEGIYEEED